MISKLGIRLATIALLAYSAASVAELKIGYVSTARLLEDAPQADAATKRLKQEFAPREENILGIQKKVSEMEEQLRRDGDTMTEGARRNLERDVVSQKRELKRVQDEFREDLNFRRNEEIGKLQKLVKEIIERVGKDDKYDVILFDGVAFASPKIDLTPAVLDQLKLQLEKTNGKPADKPAAKP